MKRILRISITLTLTLSAGCTTYGVIDNDATGTAHRSGYSWAHWAEGDHNDRLTVMLSFSGGGTRAAALAYGVLQGLRDTKIEVDGETVRLLDEVDYISSVSGGSFAAAYYGLHGDGIFEDFEETFLLRDVEQHLFWGLANPGEWFRQGGRTEMAIRYYNEHVFHDATFADMPLEDGPLILINASDLGGGVRFSFIQEYFNLICSDIDSFPVAKAVAASSAVPIVFLPVVLENYPECGSSEPPWLKTAKEAAQTDPLIAEMTDGIDSLVAKDRRQYVHLVDGGITDNLGLHALYDIVTLSGGPSAVVRGANLRPPERLILIAVNASTDPEPAMDLSNAEPSVSETVGAMSDVQLHRYNTTTVELMKDSLRRWASELSTPDHTVDSHFVRVGLRSITEPERRVFFNQIPTSFVLTQEQVDGLEEAGRQLLFNDPEYQRAVEALGGSIDRASEPDVDSSDS